MDYAEIIKNLGLSDKAAKVYLASLELGEASVNDLSRHSGLKRTSIYYVLPELLDFGAIEEVKRLRKHYFVAEDPKDLLKRARERITKFEDSMDDLELRKHIVHHRPGVHFFYGSAGFKQVWDKLFQSKEKNYRIMTSAYSFLDFVKEKYIFDEIIKAKKSLGFASKQIVTDIPYNRKIVERDLKENRVSKFLPKGRKLSFTELICSNFVAFISPRPDNLIMMIESDSFVENQISVFDSLWDSLPDHKQQKNNKLEDSL